MSAARNKKVMVQGAGPSKRHNAADAPPDPYRALAGLHCGGRPIEELPLEDVMRLSYSQTDEGIRARNAGKAPSAARVTSPARAPVTASEFGRSVEERRDFRQSELQPWEAPDPMRELVEAHVPDGMSPKFLSEKRCARDGTRGYEIVRDGKGDPVRLGNMVLGVMPKEKARARNEHYRKMGAARLNAIEDEHRERQREITGG